MNLITFRSAFIFRVVGTLTSVTIRMGFADDASATPPNNGIYFETTAGSWTGIAQSGGAQSVTSGSSTLDNLFHTFQIANDGANNVTFWDNDTLLGTLTSHIPNSAVVPFFDIQSTNSTTKTFNMDAFQFAATLVR
jgi:hypothetical protein